MKHLQQLTEFSFKHLLHVRFVYEQLEIAKNIITV